MNIHEEMNAERKAAWFDDITENMSEYGDFYQDGWAEGNRHYEIDVTVHDGQYDVSVSTSSEDLDNMILAGAWFSSDHGYENDRKVVGSIWHLTEHLEYDELLAATYGNLPGVQTSNRIADAILAFCSDPDAVQVSCDVDTPEMSSWTITVGNSAESLDDAVDVLVAAEDVLTRFMNDAGPSAAQAVYGALTAEEKQGVQEVLGAILESVES